MKRMTKYVLSLGKMSDLQQKEICLYLNQILPKSGGSGPIRKRKFETIFLGVNDYVIS
jgi:hypothetical protein